MSKPKKTTKKTTKKTVKKSAKKKATKIAKAVKKPQDALCKALDMLWEKWRMDSSGSLTLSTLLDASELIKSAIQVAK
jgi:hypothetical protein